MRQETSKNKPFILVGIGASAGGFEAFSKLLENLPLDTGMAFVLIQHLLPSQESALTEILKKKTQMVVHDVTDKMHVVPNHVDIIPPNANMTIEVRILTLTPRINTHRPHH